MKIYTLPHIKPKNFCLFNYWLMNYELWNMKVKEYFHIMNFTFLIFTISGKIIFFQCYIDKMKFLHLFIFMILHGLLGNWAFRICFYFFHPFFVVFVKFSCRFLNIFAKKFGNNFQFFKFFTKNRAPQHTKPYIILNIQV